MAAIITDTFDYSDIVRVLDLDEAFVFHQVKALQSKYWRIVIKTKPQGMKIFQPVMVSGNRGIDYLIYMLSRDWQVTKGFHRVTLICDESYPKLAQLYTSYGFVPEDTFSYFDTLCRKMSLSI